MRLEAVWVEESRLAAVMELGGVASRRAGMVASLDRRAAAVQGDSVATALLGYAVLPWCDVTLRCVAPAAAQGAVAADEAWHVASLRGCPRQRAHMRLELEQIDDALAYVERMPVEQGLVSKPWRWRWSSAAWHCGFGTKPVALAPEWTGPARRDLWRERLAGAFVGQSDRSVPLERIARDPRHALPEIVGSAVDRLVRRVAVHSPGMPSAAPAPDAAPMPMAAPAGTSAMEPSQGELALA